MPKDEVLEDRIEAISKSLKFHRDDGIMLGDYVHSAARAAVLAGGGVKAKRRIHQRANLAKHEGLHTQHAVDGLRPCRGGTAARNTKI